MKQKDNPRYHTDRDFAEMIALRIRQLRYEHNYTQEFVIDKTRLDIHRYEAGSSVPLLMSLLKICQFYKITLDEFFAPMNYPPKE